MKKNILIFYVVTMKHVENLKIIENFFLNYKIIYLFEKKLNLINQDYFLKNNMSFKYNFEFENFIEQNKNLIKLIIFSTGQPRHFPIDIFYYSVVQNIKTVSLQETNQFFLHNGKINNYLLPTDKYFLLSDFELKLFTLNNYCKSKLVNTGIFYNYKYQLMKKNEMIIKDKKKVLLILNASTKIFYNSSESKLIQINLINTILNVLPTDHQLIIKQHPAETFNLTFKDKEILLCDKNSNILDIINESNLILTTGYTQSIFDTLYLKKKIVFIQLKNEKFFDYINSELVYSVKNIKKIFNNDYDFKPKKYENLIKTNINFENKDSIKNLTKEIINLLNYNKFTKSNNDLIEFYLWLVSSNKIKKSKEIYSLLIKQNVNDKSFLNILNLIKNISLFKLSLIDSIYIFNYFKNLSVQNILIFFIMKNININKLEVNDDYLEIFKKLPQIFVHKYFEIEIKNFLNYVYLHDIQIFIKLIKLNHFNFFLTQNNNNKLFLKLKLNHFAFKNKWYRKLIIFYNF